MLKHKPANERWAVLVNEFGEIGVDGSLIEGQINHDKNVFVQEVTGGCMCCSSGLTMQVALNQLLLDFNYDQIVRFGRTKKLELRKNGEKPTKEVELKKMMNEMTN